jgi:hypothetical protein
MSENGYSNVSDAGIAIRVLKTIVENQSDTCYTNIRVLAINLVL